MNNFAKHRVLNDSDDSASASSNTLTTFYSNMYQSGSDEPRTCDQGGAMASAFQDEIEGVWTYNATGSYYYTKVGAFPTAAKVIAYSIPVPNVEGADVAVQFNWISANVIEMVVGKLSSFVSPATFTLTDSLLSRIIVIQTKP